VSRKKVDKKDVAAELLPGASIELMKELHLLTREGDLNADARRKMKQINHLVALLRPALEDVLSRHVDPVIVDAGAGNGYLGFLIAELILRPAGRGTLYAVESKGDLAERTRERVARLGLQAHFRVVAAEIEKSELPERVHLLVALHACDTATDDAMLLALDKNVDHVALVPCCQAEVAEQLRTQPPKSPGIATLAKHPWHRRELGSHLTNVIRALVLESRGYRVTVTELVGLEHSLKNELILGKRVQRFDDAAEASLKALLEESGVRPKVVRLMRERPATRTDGQDD
jgi:SAM-dependent methyltransferase